MIKNQQSAVATTVRHRPQVAANPIPYWAKDGKSKAVFDQAFADFADIGFTAVKADVPEGMTAAEYATWIGSYGLARHSACSAPRSTRPSTSSTRSNGPSASPPTRWSSASTGR